jgi:DNA end-binding protein Ku
MARALWSGSLNFGLVNVPVKAFAAVHDHDVHFHQLDPKGNRVSYEKRSSKTGQKVDKDDIVLGYELSPGHYVQLDPDELAELRPRTNRTLEVDDFVDLADIDPVFYQHTYWLAPADEAAASAYKLLASAMEAKGRVGIGTVVMRNKQYLAAVRPVGGLLAMSTMRFADEVVAGEDVDGMPTGKTPDAKHLKLANQIIDALATEWDPTRYHDTYTEELRDLIARRAKGEAIEVDEEEPEQETNVVDLMAALEASVAAARGSRGKAKPAAKGRAGAAKSATSGSKGAAGGAATGGGRHRKTGPAKAAAAPAGKGRAQTKRTGAATKAGSSASSRRSA